MAFRNGFDNDYEKLAECIKHLIEDIPDKKKLFAWNVLHCKVEELEEMLTSTEQYFTGGDRLSQLVTIENYLLTTFDDRWNAVFSW